MNDTDYILPEEQTRSARVIGVDAVRRLAGCRVAVFGIGGVGGHLCEALARAGVGHLTLVDKDEVSLSNINRQMAALHSTVGCPKAEVMRARILDINPDCEVTALNLFYLPENADTFDLSGFDFVADAVDNVAAKVELAVRCDALGVPLIAAMGAGCKTHPELFRVADIYKTNTDPLARVMRRELHARGVKRLTVVYSEEQPVPPQDGSDARTPGSLSFVPGVMGMVMAGEIIRRLCGLQ